MFKPCGKTHVVLVGDIIPFVTLTFHNLKLLSLTYLSFITLNIGLPALWLIISLFVYLKKGNIFPHYNLVSKTPKS